jgi:hypothetical protein|tara:strand:- start:490 stop:1593 length:1104 start_codon:yes stop_codon:yes gene_type:complete
MRNLKEAKYEDIFSPETLQTLKGKSSDSLRQMVGDKDLMSTMRRSKELIDQIAEAEKGHEENLVKVAIDIVRQVYPIIDYNEIRIDATLGAPFTLEPPEEEEEEQEEPTLAPDSNIDLEKKRRIINAITQGASIRGAFSFLLFREHLDEIDSEVTDKYNEILKLSFGIYDDDEAIALMLSMMGQGQMQQGGESEMEYDEENEQFIIKANAICFPMLVHEIVKGLHEIIGTEGFGTDRDTNKSVIDKVDTLPNEPEDLRYGKFIYDGLRNLYDQTNSTDDRVRELFLAEVYKMNDANFFKVINAVINNNVGAGLIKWAQDKVNEILSDLRDDDIDDMDGVNTNISSPDDDDYNPLDNFDFNNLTEDKK